MNEYLLGSSTTVIGENSTQIKWKENENKKPSCELCWVGFTLWVWWLVFLEYCTEKHVQANKWFHSNKITSYSTYLFRSGCMLFAKSSQSIHLRNLFRNQLVWLKIDKIRRSLWLLFLRLFFEASLVIIESLIIL